MLTNKKIDITLQYVLYRNDRNMAWAFILTFVSKFFASFVMLNLLPEEKTLHVHWESSDLRHTITPGKTGTWDVHACILNTIDDILSALNNAWCLFLYNSRYLYMLLHTVYLSNVVDALPNTKKTKHKAYL